MLKQLRPMLEQAFGAWQAPASARPVKRLDAPVPAPQPRIVLVDRPNSPQSVIVGGRVLPLKGTDQDREALDLANEVLGSGFGDEATSLNKKVRVVTTISYRLK